MEAQYFIVEPNMLPAYKRAARALNLWGGLGPARVWGAVGIALGWVPLVVALTISNAIGYVLLAAGALIHWLTYRFIWQPILQLPPAKSGKIIRTSDPGLISLDKEWMQFILSLPDEQQVAEDARRSISVKALAVQEMGAARVETTLQYRRALQNGQSPYPTM